MNSQTVLYTSDSITDNPVKEMAEEMETPLISVSGVFPFELFPDDVIVRKHRVDIIRKIFFKAKHVFPIMIADLITVRVTTSLLFATLKFEIKGFEQNPQPITYLPKKQAQKVRSIIMGLIACHKRDINLESLGAETLCKKVEEIGMAEEY